MRWLKITGRILASICWGILLVRAWMRESSHGAYFMTPIWAMVFLLSLFSLVYWIRQKQ